MDYFLKELTKMKICHDRMAIKEAVQLNDVERLRRLLDEREEDANNVRYSVTTAFMLAARLGHIECLKCLLDTELIDVNHQDNEGKTAIMLATLYNRAECLKSLLDTGLIDVNHQDNEGKTAIMLAVYGSPFESREFLLYHEFIYANRQGIDENTALMLAACFERIECLKCLLDTDLIDVNLQDKKGKTVLMLAARYGYIDCVKCLLNTALIDVNHQDNKGNTAFMLAARSGHTDCVKCLLNTRLIDVNHQDNKGNTALMLAARSGHTDCVKCLLDIGLTNLNIQNNEGDTALELATNYNRTECFAAILELRPDENVTGSIVSTLFEVASIGDIEKARFLFNSDFSDKDQNRTQQHQFIALCAIKGRIECIEFLLANDESLINTRDNDGRNLLMLAALKGHFECARYFYEGGVDIIENDKDGRTALMLAAKNGHLECLRYLIRQGAYVHVQDKYGMTAFLLAIKNGHAECLRCFVDITVANGTLPSSTLDIEQEERIFSIDYPDVAVKYFPGIEWSDPYVYKGNQEQRSVVNLDLCNGITRCPWCYFRGRKHIFEDPNHLICSVSEFQWLGLPITEILFDFKGDSILTISALNNAFGCFGFLIQLLRIELHMLVCAICNDNYSKYIDSKLSHFKTQFNGLARLVKQGIPDGVCVDFLLSALICQCNKNGQSAMSLAVYEANQSKEKRNSLGLLVRHISDYHKKSIQMPSLFLNAARDLAELIYLPIFLKAEIFDWSWYPHFPRRRQRLLARELVLAGYRPGQFEWRGRPSSPLHHAFMIQDIGLVQYLVANLYLTSSDLDHFQNDTELRDHLHRHGSERIRRLHGQLCGTPWRLEALSVLNISSLLKNKKRDKDMERLEPLPADIEVRLGFMHPLRWLCVRQWHLINTNFLFNHDPVLLDVNIVFDRGTCCNGACQRTRIRRQPPRE